MKRIFATLAVVSTLFLLAAYVLGWMIDDPRDLSDGGASVRWHFLSAVGGLMFAALVHAIVLTYFMGTGRWLEETSNAYKLGDTWTSQNRKIKYGTLPWMAGALLLLILAGAFGAIADPASRAGVDGFFGIPAATVHNLVASFALAANMAINYLEYSSIARNSELVDGVLAEVLRIRKEKNLPVET